MWEEIRIYARLMHLAFAALFALVGYFLTWYTLQDSQTTWKWYSCVFYSALVASACALVSHCILDWIVGVP